MSKIWIACWDCGEQVQVPSMEKYQTHQICEDCKAKRKADYERLVACKS